jgi:hypothetical protein
MKHLTFADKDLLIGDTAADLIIEYTVLLAKRSDADSVTINAYGADGNEVSATLLLDQGAVVIAETSHNSLPEPDNQNAESYLRNRIDALTTASTAQPLDAGEVDLAIEDMERGYGRDGKA